MNAIHQDIATELEQALAARIGVPRYNLWFARNTRFSVQEGAVIVGVPNRHFEEWLGRTFGSAVEAAAAEVLGQGVAVRFVIDPELFQAARREQAEATQTPTLPHPALTAQQPGVEREEEPAERPVSPREKGGPASRGRRWHRMADFVVGACNRVAHAAALSAVEEPGQGSNPLVIHGPVGTGKTHLLEAIYLGLRKAHPEWKVMFLTSEEFTNRFLGAVRAGKMGALRRQLRDCDVLLIDDLHFLASKKATIEELLHTFDVLLSEGRQMVFTCDCHPRLDEDYPPEVADRLLGGGVWGLQPPDAETRRELLRRKAAMLNLRMTEEVLEFLASQLRGNVRELEGALNSLRHFSRITNRTIDVALVREALAELLRHAIRVLTPEDVDAAVCRALRLDPGLMQGAGRAWAVSHPRMLAMYLCRKHTAASHADIGKYFGNRNHSTVVAAEKKVRQWIAEDGELALGERKVRVREVIERIERELQR
jgi:chromosomal replication initiator protein